MRYTVIIDNLDLRHAVYAGADTLEQAKAEVRAHLHDHPGSTNVVAEVGEPGDEHPRWLLVVTRRRGIRALRGVLRTPDGVYILPEVIEPTPEPEPTCEFCASNDEHLWFECTSIPTTTPELALASA